MEIEHKIHCCPIMELTCTALFKAYEKALPLKIKKSRSSHIISILDQQFHPRCGHFYTADGETPRLMKAEFVEIRICLSSWKRQELLSCQNLLIPLENSQVLIRSASFSISMSPTFCTSHKQIELPLYNFFNKSNWKMISIK